MDGWIRSKCSRTNIVLPARWTRQVEVRIADPDTLSPLPLNEQGEICIRSHRIMLSYINEQLERTCFTADGYYRSGDLGFLDAKGFLTITDRLDRLISRDGEKISLAELENVLLNHPDIEEALVISVPDDLYGEQLCACVVPKKGVSVSDKQLRSELALQLSAFKLPYYFVMLPCMPLAACGKISVEYFRSLALEGIEEKRRHAQIGEPYLPGSRYFEATTSPQELLGCSSGFFYALNGAK